MLLEIAVVRSNLGFALTLNPCIHLVDRYNFLLVAPYCCTPTRGLATSQKNIFGNYFKVNIKVYKYCQGKKC